MAKKGGKVASSREYTADSKYVKTKKGYEDALSEFAVLQDEAIGTHYLDWAAHNVNYARLESDEAAENLRHANSAYTMSILMNCVSPLRKGVRPSTLLQSMLSYKLIAAINPSMSADMSMMCSNLRESLSAIRESTKAEHRLVAGILSPVFKSVDGYLASTSSEKMQSAVKEGMASGDLDHIIMTPKQVAALKVNFMEQYYADMRTSSRPAGAMERDYNKAVDHLAVIAKNSGFDMSVVAAEERYLVGLKMARNKNYYNLFEETANPYGAHPAEDSDGKWSGKFKTADGHEYTVGGDASHGAFTPRKPLQQDQAVSFENSAWSMGKRFMYMQMWLNSDDCDLDDSVKEKVAKNLNETVSEYRDRWKHMMREDGVGGNNKRASNNIIDEVWKKTFLAGMQTARSEGESVGYKGFCVELHRIVDKEFLQKNGITPVVSDDENTFKNIEDGKECKELMPLVKKFSDKMRHARIAENVDVTGPWVVKYMREQRISNMDANALTSLLMHTGANQQQGVSRTGREDGNAFRSKGQMDPLEGMSDAEQKSLEAMIHEMFPQDYGNVGGTFEDDDDFIF